MARAIRENSPGGWQRLTQLALLLALGLTLARALMLETLRDPFEITPAQEMLLRSPGAMVSTLLDALSFLPALLVCLRAVGDRTFRLRWSAGLFLFSLLGLWAISSIFWSVDRFAAAVSAGKFLAGAAIAWTMIQTIRNWRTFRIVSAALGGLLAVLILHSAIYRLVDVPDLKANWEHNKTQILQEHHWEPGSFAAVQFEKRVLGGELIAFCASPNSLAALAVLLALLLAGDLAQKWQDHRQANWLIFPGLVLLGAAWMMVGTHCRTAAGTSALGLLLLAGCWKWRAWIISQRRRLFVVAILAFFAGWGAVIGHGLYHGSLLQRSLTFRWHYWVASFALFRDHLLTGVGWENFGQYYLQYRLPVAPEEIRDPHNLFVHFATELGLIGLLLAIGWLGVTWWELTRPATAAAPAVKLPPVKQEPLQAIAPFSRIAVVMTLLVLLAAIDWTQEPAYWLVESLRRVLYGAAFIGTAALLALGDFANPRLEDRPAPLLLLAATIGAGMFLIHNCIDFAMFETGPWYVFLVLLGTIIGMRLTLTQPGETPARRFSPWLALGVWLVLLPVQVGVILVPVCLGEDAARRGDMAIINHRFAQAPREFTNAFASSMWLDNSDYLLRKARAEAYAGAGSGPIVATLDQALAINPRSLQAYVSRAGIFLNVQPEKALGDYLQALKLNPTDMDLHLQAAATLELLNRKAEALAQYKQTLALNEQFPQEEIKRLDATRVQQIQGKIRELSAP